MSRYVKICCLTSAPLPIDPKLDLNEAVERMIGHWRSLLAQALPDKPDLIVLPEACDRPETGSYPLQRRLEYYRCRGNRIRDFFAEVARQNRCYIAYSAHREAEDGSWRNSTQLLDRSGSVVGVYNKNHLVIEECSVSGIRYGKEAPLILTDFGTVACAICFDLNFDELRLKYAKARPDLILFSSAYHGGFMQQYWAYSCRAHFAGSIYPHSPSAIISPVGEVLAESTNYFHYVIRSVNLDCAVIHLDYNGRKLQQIKDKYGSKISIRDPGRLGSVLLSSESGDFTAADIVKEFELELLDDYLARALAHRRLPGNIETGG